MSLSHDTTEANYRQWRALSEPPSYALPFLEEAEPTPAERAAVEALLRAQEQADSEDLKLVRCDCCAEIVPFDTVFIDGDDEVCCAHCLDAQAMAGEEEIGGGL